MTPPNPSRGRTVAVVWLGIWKPAPDNPPRRERVQHVFATEAAANAWADEYNRLPNKMTGAWRTVERHEVIDRA